MKPIITESFQVICSFFPWSLACQCNSKRSVVASSGLAVHGFLMELSDGLGQRGVEGREGSRGGLCLLNRCVLDRALAELGLHPHPGEGEGPWQEPRVTPILLEVPPWL